MARYATITKDHLDLGDVLDGWVPQTGVLIDDGKREES